MLRFRSLLPGRRSATGARPSYAGQLPSPRFSTGSLLQTARQDRLREVPPTTCPWAPVHEGLYCKAVTALGLLLPFCNNLQVSTMERPKLRVLIEAAGGQWLEARPVKSGTCARFCREPV